MAYTSFLALLFTLGVFHLCAVNGQIYFDVKVKQSSLKNPLSFTQWAAFASQDDNQQGHEVFQLHYPYLARPYFGQALKQVKVLDHIFGATYGHPAVVNYTPPDFDFDKVVLTLNTSVNGVQFDRLAHLFLEGRSIWRSSTIEPGGRLSYSSFQKDVSEYSILFQENGTLVFQLDNVVDSTYTGKFHVELYADFYKSTESYEETNTLDSIFSTHFKPSSILPVGSSSIIDPSVKLPAQSFIYDLPEVPQNTTRLRLTIFTSGNGEEEFYYTNVLDKYTTWTNGTSFYGHGPLRLLNVLYNGKLIASVNPQPVIFTGGLSPSLWNPVVSTSAFDLRSYNVDLTALLPDLWEGSFTGNNKLEIKVSNGGVGVDAINSVWSASANLFTWESVHIKSASGTVQITDKKPHVSVVDLSSASIINTIFSGQYSSRVDSQFDIELADGTTHTLGVRSQVDSSASNVEKITNYGLQQTNVLSGTTDSKFALTNGKDPVIDTLVVHEYPLVVTVNQTNLANSTQLDVELVGGKSSFMTLNGARVIDSYSLQNGTSTFFISANGNHGDARTTSKFRFTMSPPYEAVDYYRRVDTHHNQVVSDTNTPPLGDDGVASLLQSLDSSIETAA